MASNLSALLTDAFTIYSEAYVRIGEIGVEVANLAGSPRQPKRINQLITSTRLYRVISPSIILNDDGDAIEGIYGDIATINDLLLKLKCSVGLYDVPAFPTPLTDFVFNFGDAGGASVDATYITVNSEGLLPQSRRLALGSDGILSLTDGGPLGNYVLQANLMFVASVSAAAPVIDMNSEKERFFVTNAPITGARSWTVNGDTNARRFELEFTISGLTPGGTTHDQTWPARFKMSDARWTPGTKKWRPVTDGTYQAIAWSYDNGTNWKLEISEIYE